MGELKIGDIAIINGRTKLMRISNELGVSKGHSYKIYWEMIITTRS